MVRHIYCTRKIPRVYPEILGVSYHFHYFPGIFHAFQGFHMLSQDVSCFPRGFVFIWRTKSMLTMPYAHPHHYQVLALHSPITLYAHMALPPYLPMLTSPITPYAHLHPSTILTWHSTFITPYDFLPMRAPSLRALK